MLPEVRVDVQALIAAAQVPDPVIRDQQSEVIATFPDNSAAAEECWGVFEVNVGDQLVFSKKELGRHATIEEVMESVGGIVGPVAT